MQWRNTSFSVSQGKTKQARDNWEWTFAKCPTCGHYRNDEVPCSDAFHVQEKPQDDSVAA